MQNKFFFLNNLLPQLLYTLQVPTRRFSSPSQRYRDIHVLLFFAILLSRNDTSSSTSNCLPAAAQIKTKNQTNHNIYTPQNLELKSYQLLGCAVTIKWNEVRNMMLMLMCMPYDNDLTLKATGSSSRNSQPLHFNKKRTHTHTYI